MACCTQFQFSPAPPAKSPPDTGGKVAAPQPREGVARFGTAVRIAQRTQIIICRSAVVPHFRVLTARAVPSRCLCNLVHAWSVAFPSHRERHPGRGVGGLQMSFVSRRRAVRPLGVLAALLVAGMLGG